MATGRDVIRVLDGRKGFDWWWDDLDGEIRDDIVAELDALPGMEPSPAEDDDEDDDED